VNDLFAIADHCKHHRLKKHWILRTAAIWQSVLIPCDFPTNAIARWTYCRAESYELEHITTNGLIANNLKDRFRLETNGLLIIDVEPSDAGWYICLEKHSRRKRIIQLSVPCKYHFIIISAKEDM